MKTLLGLALSCLLVADAVRAAEPVLGLPCEECALVFVGMPAEPGSRARIAPVDAKGEPMTIEGTVRTRDGSYTFDNGEGSKCTCMNVCPPWPLPCCTCSGQLGRYRSMPGSSPLN